MEIRQHRPTAGSVLLAPLCLSLLILFSASCALKPSPHALIVLADRPMNGTFVTAYPSIETIYVSDDHVEAVVCWKEVIGSKGHTLRWELVDDQERIVFADSVTDIPIRKNMYYAKPVEFDQGKISPGRYTLRLYQDGHLSLTRPLVFSERGVLNQTVSKAVILPFKNRSTETNMSPDQEVMLASTISHAMYCHVKRYVRETVPQHVTIQELGGEVPEGCFEQTACRERLERHFGQGLYITGSIRIRKWDNQGAELEVQVLNSGTGDLRRYAAETHQRQSYDEVIHSLMEAVLRERGLLADLEAAKP